VKICCGGIIGLGESLADRLAMAYQLKELNVDVVPLNVLIPISGTKLENAESVSVAEIAKTFALFRLILPDKIIKFAAGRETKMKDFQGLLMLAGANGFLTGGYLTTRGREIMEDQKFKEELSLFTALS
ncbi:MAG: biotin synthase, partial [Spirochaetes bacterium]|nr:biotin synthase [Spirochaetota bacterium]